MFGGAGVKRHVGRDYRPVIINDVAQEAQHSSVASATALSGYNAA